MGKGKVRVTVHVSEPFEEDVGPDSEANIPRCMDSGGCGGCNSQASQGSKCKRSTFPIYEGTGDEPDIELEIISPLSDGEGDSGSDA